MMGTNSERPSADPDDEEYIDDIIEYQGTPELLNTAVYPYMDEVVVELTMKDETDVLVVESYQLEKLDDDHVTPKTSLPTEHARNILEALHDEGYQVEDYP